MQDTIKNRTIFCRDNLDILQGINSESIDLIYIDPPFNKKKVFTAPIGSFSEGASFKDYFTDEDVKDEWLETIREDNEKLYHFLNSIKMVEEKGSKKELYEVQYDKDNKEIRQKVKEVKSKKSYTYCYLCYMAIRIIELHRVLKDTGSFYLHCDPTMSHYLKLLLDIIFGEKNFRNEIVWSYPASPSNSTKDFPRKHDIIFRYGKSSNFIFNIKEVSIPYSQSSLDRIKYGAYKSKVMEGTEIKLRETGKLPTTVWQDIQQSYRYRQEITGYPTQKPLKLLERIIKVSSNEGGMVLDAFCGCCTTMVAAEKHNRKWLGIDISEVAFRLVKERLSEALENKKNDVFFQNRIELKEKDLGITFTGKIPNRTDRNGESGIEKKFVYVISNINFPNYYKVGVAKDCQSRLNSYQTSDPDRSYQLEYEHKTEHYRELERYIHKIFDNKLEWVQGDLHSIISEIKNFSMPKYNSVFGKLDM